MVMLRYYGLEASTSVPLYQGALVDGVVTDFMMTILVDVLRFTSGNVIIWRLSKARRNFDASLFLVRIYMQFVCSLSCLQRRNCKRATRHPKSTHAVASSKVGASKAGNPRAKALPVRAKSYKVRWAAKEYHDRKLALHPLCGRTISATMSALEWTRSSSGCLIFVCAPGIAKSLSPTSLLVTWVGG